MSIDKHVHFEMGIASAQMHKKQKQSYIYIFIFFPPVQDTFAENFIKSTQHGCHIHVQKEQPARKMQKSKL